MGAYWQDGRSETSSVVSHHVTTLSGDDILRKFWEIEEGPRIVSHSPKERAFICHFAEKHRKNEDGRFVVLLLRQNHLGDQHTPISTLMSLLQL